MKKASLAIMMIANYILVLWACLFYSFGSSLGFPVVWPLFIISQILLVVLNYRAADDKFALAFLSVNLVISTVAANMLFTHLYYSNISSDSGTLDLGNLALAVGVVFVAVLSLISILVKKGRPE